MEDRIFLSDRRNHFERVARHLRKHALGGEDGPDTFVSGFDAESTATKKEKKAVPRALMAAASPVLARYLREAEEARPGHDIHLILEGTSASTIGLLQQFLSGVTITSISKEQADEFMLLCKMLKISKETITVEKRENMISTDNEEQKAKQAENKTGETKKKHLDEVDKGKETISSDSLNTDEPMSKSHTEEPSPRAKKKKNPSNEVDSGKETILTDSLDPDEAKSFIEEAAPKVKSPKNKKPETAVSGGIDPSKKTIAISEEAASEVDGGEHEEKEDEGNLSDFVTDTQTVPLKRRLSKVSPESAYTEEEATPGVEKEEKKKPKPSNEVDSGKENEKTEETETAYIKIHIAKRANVTSPEDTTTEPTPKKLSKLQLSRRWSETAKGSVREPPGKQVTTEKPSDQAVLRTPSKSPNRKSLASSMLLRFSELNSEKKGPPKVALDKEMETMSGKEAKKKGDKISSEAPTGSGTSQCTLCPSKYPRPYGLARHLVLQHYHHEIATFLDPTDNLSCSECGRRARDRSTMLIHLGLKHKRILEYCSREELAGTKIGVGHEDKQEKRHRDGKSKKASRLESVKGTDSELGNHDSDIEDDENEENCFHED